MKILHIITSLKIGGAESALYNLLESRAKDGNEYFVIFFYDGPNRSKIEKLGIPAFKITGIFFRYDLLAFFRLNKIVRKIKPDIIHSGLWSANIFSKMVAKFLNIPLVCDLHSNFEYDGFLRKLFELPTLLWTDKYVAVSNSVKKGLAKTFFGFFKKYSSRKKLASKILVIKNGIDIKRVSEQARKEALSRDDLSFDKSDFVIGAVGRLEPIKSYDLLIRSFSLLCKALDSKKVLGVEKIDVKLCIVGDGSQRSLLEGISKKLGLKSNIFFMGEQLNSKKFYPVFDCFVISSESEGLSISILEALSFGLPIITTNCNIKHDVISDGINGLIVPSGDEKSLYLALEQLYLDPILCKKIRKNNLELAEKDFSINRVRDSYNQLYKKLIFKN